MQRILQAWRKVDASYGLVLLTVAAVIFAFAIASDAGAKLVWCAAVPLGALSFSRVALALLDIFHVSREPVGFDVIQSDQAFSEQ